MKDWITIGQFSKLTKITSKALRLYEEKSLLKSHLRGENGYRYYNLNQVEIANRLKEFKDLGFSLTEIKELLNIDKDFGSRKLLEAMQLRLSCLNSQFQHLSEQKNQIENILTSLVCKTKPLKAEQRRAIMSHYGKVSIVVTGKEGLQKTAYLIQNHFKKINQNIPILKWELGLEIPEEKPHILILEENNLASSEIKKINPDVVVIKNFAEYSQAVRTNYLNLYTEVGPHVNTILNADDMASVDFASQTQVKKGRIFYYSKNRALENQIKEIGGLISDGSEFRIYGFNLKQELINLKLDRIMTSEDEMAFLSSIGAVMTLGLEKEHLNIL